MAGFGGGGQRRPPWQQEMPGLMGFPGGQGAAAGPPVFQAGNPSGMPGIPGLSAAVHAGGHNPAVTLAGLTGQAGVSYPRPLGPGFATPGGAAGHAQLLQQQAHQAAAAQAAVTLQQQQQHLQQQAAQQQAQSKSGQSGQSNQRVFTGTVTKFHENFGFVDNDVFFQTSVVKGHMPKANDRVLVEASYNPNMPFKWNATRVQVLPGQPAVGGASGASAAGSVNPTATPNAQAFGGGGHHVVGGGGGGGNHHVGGASSVVAPKRGGGNDGFRDSRNDSRRQNNSKDNRNSDSRRRGGGGGGDAVPTIGVGRIGDRDRSKDQRSPAPRKRSRSPRRSTRSRSRSRSPPRRRQRAIPRYSVSVPKFPLHFPCSTVVDLKKRYNNMYIPSDFFMADHVCNTSFPIHQPFKFQYPSSFHVFSKDQVELPIASDAVFDPQDSDHTWNAKVMLMAVPPPEELYLKTCQMADSSFHNKDSLIHPTRAIQFLVGVRGKNEAMAIGGAWSPSLDGADPGSNPSVLVKTAIRACKALTGIDLSSCTKWCRFMEIHYRRQETSSKPARTETTVIYLPDIWSVMPNGEEFENLQKLYADALDAKINPKKKEAPKKDVKAKESTEDELDEQEVELMESEKAEEASLKASEPEKKLDEEEPMAVVDNSKEASIEEPKETEEKVEEDDKPEPTNWKDLDSKSMKVDELRAELETRNLNSEGLKSQLVVRLQKALKLEEEKECTEAAKEEESKDEEAKAEEAKADKAKADEEPMEEEKAEKTVDTETAVEEVAKDEEPMEEPAKEEVKEVADESPEIMEVEEVIPELDEKQKAALTSAYKVPEKPCILVHPHPKAKSGKFDCTVMSLSVLLDYRTDDNKEGTFEVSLFAEVFNEMLMRDSGYKMYRAIVDFVPPPKEVDSPKEEGEEPKKMVTRNKDLLMACSYFDLGHGGYIETKDVEDILQATMSLSRAQIKKAVTRVGQKDKLSYRQFTDRPENEEPKPLELKSVEEEALIGQGFKAFLPKAADEKSEDGSAGVAVNGVCSFKGTVVDIGKLMSQLERSEQEKFDSESRIEAVQKILCNLKDAAEKHNSVKEKLQGEVKDLKKKLRSTEDELKKVQGENTKFLSTITHVYNRVSPIAALPQPEVAKDALSVKSETKELQNGKSSTPTADVKTETK